MLLVELINFCCLQPRPHKPKRNIKAIKQAESLYENKAWFVGKMGRQESEDLLLSVGQQCDFLIRESTNRVCVYQSNRSCAPHMMFNMESILDSFTLAHLSSPVTRGLESGSWNLFACLIKQMLVNMPTLRTCFTPKFWFHDTVLYINICIRLST